MTKLVRMEIRLPESQRREFHVLCIREGKSMNSKLRELIASEIEQDKRGADQC
jgi:hypothetical protein